MRTKEFLTHLDHNRIVAAIRAAETKTAGEIRVYLQRGEFEGDPLVAAQAKFQELGMEKTVDRNGILIFVMPRARKFAVIGDKGIHEKRSELRAEIMAQAELEAEPRLGRRRVRDSAPAGQR